MTDLSSLPLSRLVPVSEIASSGTRIVVTPTAAERAALAGLTGLVSIGAMTATMILVTEGPHGVHVTGSVKANVTQTCVVSLDPFESEVEEPVDVHFLTPEALEVYRTRRAAEVAEDDENTPDEPDPILNGAVDVGALAAEYLALGLDPYPRKPGAALPVPLEPEEAPVSPFAVLRQLDRGES